MNNFRALRSQTNCDMKVVKYLWIMQGTQLNNCWNFAPVEGSCNFSQVFFLWMLLCQAISLICKNFYSARISRQYIFITATWWVLHFVFKAPGGRQRFVGSACTFPVALKSRQQQVDQKYERFWCDLRLSSPFVNILIRVLLFI